MSDQLSNDLASLKIDRDAPRGGSGVLKIVLWLVLVGGVVAAAAFIGYPFLASRVFKSEVEITEIGLVSPAQASVDLTASGYVAAKRTAKVGARLIARIAEIRVEEGQTVKAGDVIAVLEDADLKSQVQSARSRVLSARARAQTARAALNETQLVIKREQKLVEQGVSPQATLDDLKARAASQLEQVRAADAEVRAFESEIAPLEANLANTVITSPIDGTVIERLAEPGEMINYQVGGTIVEIADFNSLVVEIDVAESKLHLLKLGGPSEIILDAFPGRRYRGQILEIGHKVNRSKATVMVKVKFVDSADGALPEMAARVNFLSKELDPSSMKEPPKVIVPGAALAERAGAKVVFVLADGKVRMTNVELGAEFGDGFVLLKGPSPGTKVIREPSDDLRDGQSVKEAGKK